MARPRKMTKHKVRISVTLEPEMLEWIQTKIKTKDFANITHAVEKGLLLLKDKMGRKK